MRDARQEQFARNLAEPMGVYDAYVKAGYSPDRKNAKAAANKPNLKARVRFLMQPQMHAAGIDRERALKNLAAIAFSDIRKAMSWRNDIRREEDYADGGEVMIVREIVSHKGRFIDSDKLDDDTALAIQQVEITLEGAIKIKFHPKQPALNKILEILRLTAPADSDKDKAGNTTLIQNVFNMTPAQAEAELVSAFRSARANAEPIHVIEQPAAAPDDHGDAAADP